MVSGLGNAETLIGLIESGEEHFDFVEIMACPTGCIGGAGQPESFLEDKKKRSSGLYTADQERPGQALRRKPGGDQTVRRRRIKGSGQGATACAL